MLRQVGDYVDEGHVLAEMLTDEDEHAVAAVADRIRRAFTFVAQKDMVVQPPLIASIVLALGNTTRLMRWHDFLHAYTHVPWS